MNWIKKQMDRISRIGDEEEREKQFELLNIIIDKINELKSLEFDYTKQSKYLDMKKRGMKINKMNQSGEVIRNQWINAFVNDLSNEELDDIYIDSFLWHIFSFEKKNALTKTKARRVFNSIKKDKVIMFYQNERDVFLIENAKGLKSSDFDYEQDVYIVDENFNWTYVFTHELQCGPYFYSISDVH